SRPQPIHHSPTLRSSALSAADASPLVASPAVDRIWTANARTTGGDTLARIGDGGYALGARAAQIRDALQAGRRFTEADLLAIQLDRKSTRLNSSHVKISY